MRGDESEAIVAISLIVRLIIVRIQSATIAVAVRIEQVRIAIGNVRGIIQATTSYPSLGGFEVVSNSASQCPNFSYQVSPFLLVFHISLYLDPIFSDKDILNIRILDSAAKISRLADARVLAYYLFYYIKEIPHSPFLANAVIFSM